MAIARQHRGLQARRYADAETAVWVVRGADAAEQTRWRCCFEYEAPLEPDNGFEIIESGLADLAELLASTLAQAPEGTSQAFALDDLCGRACRHTDGAIELVFERGPHAFGSACLAMSADRAAELIVDLRGFLATGQPWGTVSRSWQETLWAPRVC